MHARRALMPALMHPTDKVRALLACELFRLSGVHPGCTHALGWHVLESASIFVSAARPAWMAERLGSTVHAHPEPSCIWDGNIGHGPKTSLLLRYTYLLSHRRPLLPHWLVAAHFTAADHTLWQLTAKARQPGQPRHQEQQQPAAAVGHGAVGLYDRVMMLPDLHGDLEQAQLALQLVGATDEVGTW
eukprot:366467-Chlamydomonas_euryale.AAC.2